MGFFTKDKPIDCYKKVNSLIRKMYYIKKTLIHKGDAFNDSDRQNLGTKIDEAIGDFNSIVRMDFKSYYFFMKRDIMFGSYLIDYECQKLTINELMEKVSKEIDAIKRIVKGAPVVMSEINPNSIPKDFFYDEHQLGVYHTLFLKDPRFELPPMFTV